MAAITSPLAETDVTFDDEVVNEIVELSGGRPYYVQKLAYFAFDAAEGHTLTGRNSRRPSSAPSRRSARDLRGSLVGDGTGRAPGGYRRRLCNHRPPVRRDRA
ncbi:MAG: hypothetical protein M5T61_21105 [Acidimicrobiia bacterium]|nr:hypothetical protein [Acidimicrobiia bacterium]